VNDAMISNCPLGCAGEIQQTDLSLPEGNLRRCSVCGQLFSACDVKRYTQSMQEFDRPEGTLLAGADYQRQKKRVGHMLLRGIHILDKPPAEIAMLDVGCSSGSVLRIARDMGLAPRGVEPASMAAQTAAGMGFDVFNGYLQDAAFPEASFDMVCLFEVIEHLQAPLELAREVWRILRPGGIWLAGTGNADSWTVQALGAKWEYFDISLHGGHISFFNPYSIHLLGERTGFELASLETRRVRLAEKEKSSPIVYQASKIVRELLEPAARLFNKGHDMLAIMSKPADA